MRISLDRLEKARGPLLPLCLTSPTCSTLFCDSRLPRSFWACTMNELLETSVSEDTLGCHVIWLGCCSPYTSCSASACNPPSKSLGCPIQFLCETDTIRLHRDRDPMRPALWLNPGFSSRRSSEPAETPHRARWGPLPLISATVRAARATLEQQSYTLIASVHNNKWRDVSLRRANGSLHTVTGLDHGVFSLTS